MGNGELVVMFLFFFNLVVWRVPDPQLVCWKEKNAEQEAKPNEIQLLRGHCAKAASVIYCSW
jgi:hypothetical protein